MLQAFAKYYKFCIKPDKEEYDIIYTNLYFKDITLGATWFLLEGENSQKIEVGDKLFVKADTNGPKARCTEVTVLDKEAKTADFINPPPVDAANETSTVPAGTYMRIATNQISTELGENPVVTDDQSGRGNSGNCPKVYLNVCSVSNPDYDDSSPAAPVNFPFIPLEIPEGSTLQIRYFNKRRGGSGNSCELRECIWDATATASQNYPDVKSFWDGDNIFGLTSLAECRTDTSASPSVFSYDSSVGEFDSSILNGQTVISGDIGCSLGTNFIRFLDYSLTGIQPEIFGGQQRIALTGTKGCGSNSNRRSTMDVEITIVRTNSLIVFESTPQDALPDLWYESSKTYELTQGDNICQIEIQVDSSNTPLIIDYLDVNNVAAQVAVPNNNIPVLVTGICGSAVVNASTPAPFPNPPNLIITNTVTPQGAHQGNIQNQTSTQPAIIDASFFNCYAFGNGVESFKIQDSIIGKPLTLGNRTTSTVSEDYKEAHRFADITYSGVINDESNVNKLNEFNLGLLNFKPLEDSYGPITIIDGRETDILVLQEDKISYVLQGKNLLSDSTGGGAISSVPEVLGTQIARIEDYGNSNNPESYTKWGPNKFFTDAKRGAVLQLKGSNAQSEQLVVISQAGMRSYFRDYFINSFNTFKLGGYDPYMNEYVLNNSPLEIPTPTLEINCGITRSFNWNGQQLLDFIYQLGANVGPIEVTITFTGVNALSGVPVLGVYNGVTEINQTITSDATYVFSFQKDVVSQEELFLEFGSCGACDPQNVTIEVTVSCPDAPTITIYQIAVTSANESGQLIHDEYRWTDSVFVSALQSEQVQFQNGVGLIVSQFSQAAAPQGGNLVPANSATVRIISNKIVAQGDDFSFDITSNQLRFLRTNDTYVNTPASVQALLTASTLAAPITGGGNTFEANFPMPNTTEDKLYIIWDYRKPSLIELCYSNVSIDEACCDCSGDPVPNSNRFANLCYDAQSTVSGGVPTQVVIPPTSAVTAGTFISITAYPECTYEVGVETQNNSDAAVNTILSAITDCNQVCSTYILSTTLTGGTYTYLDCNGISRSGSITVFDNESICATQLGSLNNVTAVFECGCNLTLEIARCQVDGTSLPPNEFIDYDGATQVGDFVNITADACVWEVISTSTNTVTATKSGNASETNCNEVCNTYFVENPSSSETRTFFYTDCNGVVQSISLIPTEVQSVCMQSYTQTQQFNIQFTVCGCGF